LFKGEITEKSRVIIQSYQNNPAGSSVPLEPKQM
jgi:hypothetical protein